MIPTSMVKAKPSQHLTPEQVEREDAQQRGAGGDDRPDSVWFTAVLTMSQIVAPHAAHVLAHAVEDDDRVVDRVAVMVSRPAMTLSVMS